MPRVLNLDVFVVDRVILEKDVDGEPMRWELRDDIPTETMIGLLELFQEGVAEVPADNTVALFRAQDRLYTEVLTEMFRHTYPETTAEDLRRWFTFEQRQRIADDFFAHHWSRSRLPSSDSAASATRSARSGTKPTATVTAMNGAATPNRATRRAAARARAS